MPQSPRQYTKTVTIANGASLSDAANVEKAALVAIVMPSAWTAANLTFQASVNGTYNDVYDSAGNEVSVTAAASRHIAIDPATWQGATHIKVRSGTTGVPVNQGAERSIILVLAEQA